MQCFCSGNKVVEDPITCTLVKEVEIMFVEVYFKMFLHQKIVKHVRVSTSI